MPLIDMPLDQLIEYRGRNPRPPDFDDYWKRASSKPWLANIAVPALILNARNDPLLPERWLPSSREISACVTLELPAEGGHVGFVSGPFPGNLSWLPQRILEFFQGPASCQ